MASKILVLGAIAYDNIMNFDGYHLDNTSIDQTTKKFYLSIMPNERWMNFGGTSGNIAYNLALLGPDIQVITSVGHDYITGGYQTHHKKFKNLDMQIDIFPNLFTPSAYIVNDKANNLVNIFHPGALGESINISLKKKGISKNNTQIACISPENPGAMINWAKELTELGIPFIFDPGQVTPAFSGDVLKEILPNAFILIGNEFEIEMIQQKLGLSLDGLRKFVKNLIITQGENGSVYYTKEIEERISIVPIKSVVDPTGAGDGYRSGLLYGISQNFTLKKSCRIGAVISSFVIETAGPQNQVFTLEDVKKRYKSTFNEEL
jgi:adenosine kinase